MPGIEQLFQDLGENLILVVIGVTITVALVAAVWITIPRLLRRLLGALDRLLPGGFVVFERSISRVTVAVVSGAILIAGAEYTVSGARGDPSTTAAALITAAEWIGAWLLANGLKIVLVVLMGLIAERFALYAIPRIVDAQIRTRSGTQLEAEIQKNIETLSSVLTKAATFAILLLTVFLVMEQIGVDLGPLLVAAGVAGIAIGFGAQNLVRDMFAGAFIILENQYRINDVVNIAGIGGLVEDINLRRTVLRDLDYRQHFIPNGNITTTSNFTKDKSRVNLNIGVAYRTDLEHAIGVLNRVGHELSDDAEWGPIILDPIQVLRVDSFADSAIEIKVLGEVLPIRQWDVAGQYLLRVKRAFDEEGIEIPFPHQTLYWGEGQPNVMAMRAVMAEAQAAGAPPPADTADTDAVPSQTES